jgi:trehalose 6-phosphate phosphatase
VTPPSPEVSTASPSTALAADLCRDVERLAAAARLIVATDFDGTLSPLAPQPEAARPHPGALPVLERLAALPETYVAVVSGRSLGDLDAVAGLPDTIERIGSHGLEPSSGVSFGLDSRAHLRLRRLTAELEALVDSTPGSRIEHKPYSVAFHYRHAEPSRAERALAWLDETVDRRPGLWRKPGHMVVEVMVLPASKSWAIDMLRNRHPDSAVFYAGDDVTDEDIFADLRPGDLGCKVGDGETAATHRVPDPDAVVTLLEHLAAGRARAHRPDAPAPNATAPNAPAPNW